MSDRGSPADHTDDGKDKSPAVDAPATDQPAASPETPSPEDGNKDAKPADSSPAEGAKEAAKPTLADVVKSALEGKSEQGKPPDPAKDGKDKPDPAATAAAPEKDKDGKPVKQDDSKLPFHNHPRFQEMKTQNNQLRDQVQTLTPDADQFRKIDTFMRENSLTPDEVGEGFILMAMAKNGDARVLQKLDDFRNKVALAIGEALPDDVKAKVESGEISEAAGKQMAKDRATVKANERQLADRDAKDTNRQRHDAAVQLANAQSAAVGAWEAEARKLDPDFAKKEPAIERYARALMQRDGFPDTPEKAVTLMKTAYEEYNRDIAALIPAKAPVSRVPIAPSSNGAKPVPKNLREAIEQAAARGG
jgi:hypothetical protein